MLSLKKQNKNLNINCQFTKYSKFGQKFGQNNYCCQIISNPQHVVFDMDMFCATTQFCWNNVSSMVTVFLFDVIRYHFHSGTETFTHAYEQGFLLPW